MEPPEAAGTAGHARVTAMAGVVVIGQVVVTVLVTVLARQVSLAWPLKVVVTEQALAGTLFEQLNGMEYLRAADTHDQEIARVAGHKQTSTTELVYRRELRPVITTGAEVMDKVFSR